MGAMATGLLLLRVVVGLLFIGHGLQKLLGWFGGPGLRGTAAMFESGGYGPGRITAPLGAAAEFGGGLLLVLGLFTPIGAIALLVMMSGAVVAVHARNGLWNTNGGAEFPIVLGTVALGLTLTGPGRWSIDHLAGMHLAGWLWGLTACVVTVVAVALEIALIRSSQRRGGGSAAEDTTVDERHRDVA